MTYEFEIDGRKVRVDWDGGSRSPATITDDAGNRADFPAGLAPYKGLSCLGSSFTTARLRAQRQMLNCLDAASKTVW
ncbi:MAG: hypothetical protein LUD72_13810 [Bacteroidales bacterium]|nr:hypothetical protein [Bacteroidales bacterium]